MKWHCNEQKTKQNCIRTSKCAIKLIDQIVASIDSLMVVPLTKKKDMNKFCNCARWGTLLKNIIEKSMRNYSNWKKNNVRMYELNNNHRITEEKKKQ